MDIHTHTPSQGGGVQIKAKREEQLKQAINAVNDLFFIRTLISSDIRI